VNHHLDASRLEPRKGVVIGCRPLFKK